MVVWKADQQYPMAVLHHKDGATVPAVAIERTPWGQQEQADSLRLVSCSDTGTACHSVLMSTSALASVTCRLFVCRAVCLWLSACMLACLCVRTAEIKHTLSIPCGKHAV